jgi:hypothetical protein
MVLMRFVAYGAKSSFLQFDININVIAYYFGVFFKISIDWGMTGHKIIRILTFLHSK